MAMNGLGGEEREEGRKKGREREKRERVRARGTEREGEGREGGRPDGKHRISNCNKRTKEQNCKLNGWGKGGAVVRDRSKYTLLDIHTYIQKSAFDDEERWQSEVGESKQPGKACLYGRGSIPAGALLVPFLGRFDGSLSPLVPFKLPACLAPQCTPTTM